MHVSASERILTVIGYLPLLGVILLISRLRRDSMFVQFHVRQSFVLFLLGVVFTILMLLLLFFAGSVGILQTILFVIMFIGFGAYAFFMLGGIIKSSMGERYRMPGVADVALLMRL